MKVVVLGGGSTGEHFVGALRRLDNDVEITLVESRLVGGECSYFACMPTKTMLRATELGASLERAPDGALDYGYYNWRMTEHWLSPKFDEPCRTATLRSESCRSDHIQPAFSLEAKIWPKFAW